VSHGGTAGWAMACPNFGRLGHNAFGLPSHLPVCLFIAALLKSKYT